jgi:hypothetical protein
MLAANLPERHPEFIPDGLKIAPGLTAGKNRPPLHEREITRGLEAHHLIGATIREQRPDFTRVCPSVLLETVPRLLRGVGPATEAEPSVHRLVVQHDGQEDGTFPMLGTPGGFIRK